MVDVERIRESVSEIISIPSSELKDDMRLNDSDRWDSLAMIGTAAMIFEMTNVTVSPDEVENIVTLQDIIELAEKKSRETK